jgi:hypothetical protein
MRITNLNDARLNWALPALKTAQNLFKVSPTAQHWNQCLLAMVTYQQLDALITRPAMFDVGKVLFAFEHTPQTDWQNVVCRATAGKDARELI